MKRQKTTTELNWELIGKALKASGLTDEDITALDATPYCATIQITAEAWQRRKLSAPYKTDKGWAFAMETIEGVRWRAAGELERWGIEEKAV